jgi:hypothetical protein
MEERVKPPSHRPTSAHWQELRAPVLVIGRSNAPWLIRMVPGAQFEAQAACALHKEPPAPLAGGSTQGELGFRLHSQWVRTGFPLRGSRAVWVVPSLKLLPPKKSVTGLGFVGFRVHGAGFTAFHDASAKRVQNCFLSSLVQLDENCHGQPSPLSACNRFSIVEKRWWDCARGLAQPARVCQQVMVRQRRLFAYLAYPVIY